MTTRSEQAVGTDSDGSARSLTLPPDLLGEGRTLPTRVGRLGGTPGRMRLFGATVALVCVGFGLASGVAAVSSEGALIRAQADTEQIVRAQSIASALLEADAIATNGYLVAGEERPDQRAAYDAAMAEATSQIAAATAAQPADAEALGRLSGQVVTYAELVEHARADNRQGLPLGQRYQQLASAGLRSEALPLATAVIDANAKRLGTTGGQGEIGWPTLQARVQAVALAVAVIAITALSWWMARRTRRRLNREIAAAGILVVLVGAIGVAVQLATVQRMDSSAEAMRRAMLAAQARTLAYDGRAAESLALIARGSGAEYEAGFQRAAERLRNAQSDLGVAPGPLDHYLQHHAEIRHLEADEGDWRAAVGLAVDPSGFSPLERQLDDVTSKEVADAKDSLRSAGLLPLLRWLAPLAGALAAMLVWRGVGQRAAAYR